MTRFSLSAHDQCEMFSTPFSGLQYRTKHPLELTKVCRQCYGVYSQPEYYVPMYTTMLWNKGCYYPVEHQWDIQSNQNSVTVVLDESGKLLTQNTASCVGCGYTEACDTSSAGCMANTLNIDSIFYALIGSVACAESWIFLLRFCLATCNSLIC